MTRARSEGLGGWVCARVWTAIAAAVLIGAAGGAAATAQGLSLSPAASDIQIVYTEDGRVKRGRFTRFTGRFDFDPTRPRQASARIVVDTASLDLGDVFRQGVLATAPWLNVEAHPQAVFTLSNLTPAPRGYIASGTLTLRGRALTARFPLRAAHTARGWRATGRLTFSRRAAGLRDAVLESFVRIGDEIAIEFQLTAQ